MLKNEQRRLRVEDINKLRERQKKLELKRKIEILGKDLENSQYLKLIKDSEDLLVKKKMFANYIYYIYRQASFQKTKEALDLRQSLLEVAVKGRQLTPRTTRLIQREGIRMKS